MDLMTVEEALERWPVDVYDPDTLGGMRRESVVTYWKLAKQIVDSVPDEHRELALDWVAAAGSELADLGTQIDELQEEGLRTAFGVLMGYELPV